MNESYRISVFDDRGLAHVEELSEPVELGRHDAENDELYHVRQRNEGERKRLRLPIARNDESKVSKNQAFVEMVSENRIRLTNASKMVPIHLLMPKGDALKPAAQRELQLPVRLGIDRRQVLIESVRYASLDKAPLSPGEKVPDEAFLTIAAEDSPETQKLLPWLKATMDVLHTASSAVDCFDQAAGAVVKMFDLDSGRVMLLEGDEWRERTMKLGPHEQTGDGWKASTQILSRLRRQKKTFWEVWPDEDAADLRSFGGRSLSGVKAVVAAPILDRTGQVIGALYGDRRRDFDDSRGGEPITQVQATLIQLLASGVAAGLAQKKLVQFESEFRIGRKMQSDFLPQEMPHLDGWELATFFEPANEVSGDFYDAIALPGGYLALVVGDVCGKGVGAALYMALVRSLLRLLAEQTALAASTATEPCRDAMAEQIVKSAVGSTHNYVAQTHGRQNMFTTLFFAVLNPTSNTLTYINAGHEPPVLIGQNQVKSRLTRTGHVLGVTFPGLKPNVANKIGAVTLEPEQALFVYTDGVTEAHDGAGRLFTEKHMLTILQEPALSAQALVDNVTAAVKKHVAGAERHDDVTILAIRRKG